jgi:hypothetical protein
VDAVDLEAELRPLLEEPGEGVGDGCSPADGLVVEATGYS